jgi:hypothetical protein
VKFVGWICCIAALPAWAQNGGITPRPAAADYPSHITTRSLAIGAALIPPDRVRKMFAADLNKAGYVVVEVAVYPDKDGQPDIVPADFMLRLESGSSTLRAAEPAVVAASAVPYDKHRGAPPAIPGNVQVYTDTTIGYESGPYHRGVYTATGVGVGVGGPPAAPPPPPGSSKPKDQIRDELEMRLSAQALPAGRIAQPIAGYLYFPKPANLHKSDRFELAWFGPDGTAQLVLMPAN